jgi:hypothetical protein
MTKNKSKPLALLGVNLLLGVMSFAQSIHVNYTTDWHVPSNLECSELINDYLGGWTVAGGILKSTGTQ